MTVHLKDFAQFPGELKFIEAVDATNQKRAGFYRRVGKRGFDILFTVLIAPAVLTLVGLIALFMKATGYSPFYTQERIGRTGRLFKIYKIRTMVPNADAVLEEYLEHDAAARIEWDTTQKLKRDPRITPFGAFCRKSSLDELPQFWNVFKGDMSLIGPRPMMVDQRSLYPGTDYYELRPGITGKWQVSDRNESTFAARAVYDAEYNQTLSFRNDIAIMLRTVNVVLRCTGY